MHKRILVIAGRDSLRPFDYTCSSAQFFHSLGNSGNGLFWYAIQKGLTANGVEMEVMSIKEAHTSFERINSDFDACVMCPANVLNWYFRDHLDFLSETFGRFKIPVFIVGLGAQSVYEYDLEFMRAIKDRSQKFISSVLKTGGSIACRGCFTGEALSSIGYRQGVDYEVLGCPSLFSTGGESSVKMGLVDGIINPAFNGPEMISRPMLRRWLEIYKDSIFVSQDSAYELLYQPSSISDSTLLSLGKRKMEFLQRLKSEGRLALFCDCEAWMRGLIDAHVNFVVGTRIHGCIVAILAGIPAFVLVKDSRVRELVEFFDIPHAKLKYMYFKKPSVESLYRCADYTKFRERLPSRFAMFKKFMNLHGLPWCEDMDYIENRFSVDFPMPRIIKTLEKDDVLLDRVRELEKLNRLNIAKRKTLKTVGRIISSFVVSRNKRQLIRRKFSGE